MSEEKRKMIAGELYQAGDATLRADRPARQAIAASLQPFGSGRAGMAENMSD